MRLFVLTFGLSFLLKSAEIGTHFVRKTRKAVEHSGIILEHFVVFGFLINDVVVNFAPAFFKKGSALDFKVVAFIFYDIVQGTLDSVGDDFDFISDINLAVAGALISSRALRKVIMFGVFVKIFKTVFDIKIRIVFKLA